MRVDLPAPFSPIRAWISPWRTVRSTASLASVPGYRLVMPRSSTASRSGGCRVIDLQLSGHDLVAQRLDLLQDVLVVGDDALAGVHPVLKTGEADAALLEAVRDGRALLAAEDLVDALLHGDVRALDHVVHDRAGRRDALVDVDAVRVRALRLRGLEDAVVAGRGRRHDLVGALGEQRVRLLLGARRVVEGGLAADEPGGRGRLGGDLLGTGRERVAVAADLGRVEDVDGADLAALAEQA